MDGRLHHPEYSAGTSAARLEIERCPNYQSRMQIADRVLALIASQPGITTADIRAALPDLPRHAIAGAIRRMRENGVVEHHLHMGGYQVRSMREASSPMPAPESPQAKSHLDAFIRPATLARLMAGR